MVEWRKTQHRRRIGERRSDRIFDGLLWIAILAVLLYGSWQFGRFFGAAETKERMTESVEKAEKALWTFKIWHYGRDNFYWTDEKGKQWYVTNAKDLENKKKWRVVR